MNERTNNFVSPSMSSPGLKSRGGESKISKPGLGMESIKMHVNKFVHPCEKIPASIKAVDLKQMSADYENPELNDIREDLI
jgi:hypothetical protein